MPPAYGVSLDDHINAPGQRGYVCATCGRVFAEVPRHSVTLVTGQGHVTFVRCSPCYAQHRYHTERGTPCE